MTFPNAYHGVKKIFTAQLLKVFSAVCLIIGTIGGLVAVALGYGAEAGELAGKVVGPAAIAFSIVAVVLIAAGGILSIVSYIMNIVGLRQGGQDEEGFRLGFLFACFGMIIKFISILFTLLNVGGGIADNIADTVGYICDIIIIISVLGGIANLANRLGNENIEALARKLMNVLTAVIGLSAVASLIPAFFGVYETFLTIQGILMLVSGSLSVVGYIIYLVFLGKAATMLKEN